MHPHHVHISYASPRVKSRTGFSEEKKQEVREKDADQHRTAYHQLGDGGKNGGAEKETDYRTGSSEVKKQEVREKDADQHRTAYHQLGDDGKEARAEKKAWPCRGKHGQFAFKKSAISLANPFLAKAPSLPRRPDDAGLNIISSSGGTVEAVSKDKQIYYNFRVRRSYVQDLLKLLIRDNHLYSDYTFDEDDESWALLPDDGFHESIPIWEEAKPEDERRPIFEQGRSRRFARFDRFWS